MSSAQSAFIKKRYIHDNFMYVRGLARRLHKSKTPALLFKLDIRKAFDSVRWEYIIDLLQRRGFPPRFREWITALLRSSSSRILLNGVPGPLIMHGRGFRQGDQSLRCCSSSPLTPYSRSSTLPLGAGCCTSLRGVVQFSAPPFMLMMRPSSWPRSSRTLITSPSP